MEEQNHIDKALAFMESLEKLGNQLKTAEEHQKHLLARMLELKKENLLDSEEYGQLAQQSKSLQDIIDKWRPIYLERMDMVKGVHILTKKIKEFRKEKEPRNKPFGSLSFWTFHILG